MSSSNTSPAPWFADTGRNAVYDKRVWFDESGARFGDTPNLVVRIEGGRPADVHLIAAAPEMYAALVAAEARLRSLEKTIDSEFGDCKSEDEMEAAKAWSPEVYTARAAIAKATGENT